MCGFCGKVTALFACISNLVSNIYQSFVTLATISRAYQNEGLVIVEILLFILTGIYALTLER
jgi:hypothetical protein